MPFITILFAVDLILTGVIGYQVTGAESVTALIPAFIGAPLLLLGIVAFKEGLRKHAMHAAVMIGLLGLLGTASGFSDIGPLLNGKLELLKKPAASVSKVVTGMVCAHYVLICIWSFVEARLAARAKQG